jgi:hypothetical protein
MVMPPLCSTKPGCRNLFMKKLIVTAPGRPPPPVDAWPPMQTSNSMQTTPWQWRQRHVHASDHFGGMPAIVGVRQNVKSPVCAGLSTRLHFCYSLRERIRHS